MSRTNKVLPLALLALALAPLAAQAPAVPVGGHGRPYLPPGCNSGANSLRVPAGHKVSLHVHALGAQVYVWDGTTWVFTEPRAMLLATSPAGGVVGIHYRGPTWESNGGSKVVGARVAGCTPDPTAIPWLLLRAVSTSGQGPFADTTFIQRVNTAGGLAPAAPGMFIGQSIEVPYTAEYYFYRARR